MPPVAVLAPECLQPANASSGCAMVQVYGTFMQLDWTSSGCADGMGMGQ